MVTFLIHTLWRLLVLALASLVALLTTFILLPFLDKRLPIFPVILILYLFVAYVGIPLIIRFWRIAIKPNHIPRYVTTPDGWPADPVNIAIVAKNKRHLVRSMRAAGWYVADKSTKKNLFHEAYAIVFNKPYPTAPFSKLYLFGRTYDIGFQIAYGKNGSPRHRHHVRFWQLVDDPRANKNNHFAYWLERVKHFFRGDQTIWIGAAIDDSQPIGVRWRNLQLTHANRSDHTEERDFIIDSLKKVKLIKQTNVIKDGAPFKMRSQNIGTSFIVDGHLSIVELKSPLRVALRGDVVPK